MARAAAESDFFAKAKKRRSRAFSRRTAGGSSSRNRAASQSWGGGFCVMAQRSNPARVRLSRSALRRGKPRLDLAGLPGREKIARVRRQPQSAERPERLARDRIVLHAANARELLAARAHAFDSAAKRLGSVRANFGDDSRLDSLRRGVDALGLKFRDLSFDHFGRREPNGEDNVRFGVEQRCHKNDAALWRALKHFELAFGRSSRLRLSLRKNIGKGGKPHGGLAQAFDKRVNGDASFIVDGAHVRGLDGGPKGHAPLQSPASFVALQECPAIVRRLRGKGRFFGHEKTSA